MQRIDRTLGAQKSILLVCSAEESPAVIGFIKDLANAER